MANRSSRARLLFFLVIPCLASFLCMPLLAQDKGQTAVVDDEDDPPLLADSPDEEAKPAPPAAPAQAKPAREPEESAPVPLLSATEQKEVIPDSLTRSMIYLRSKARKDEFLFFLPPERQVKVVEYKKVEVRYTEKMVDVPVMELERTETRKVRVSTGESTDKGSAMKEIQVPIYKQVGTKKQPQEVPDPNGSIVRVHNQPVMGPGGPDLLFNGFFGQNGMAIYASLRCGTDGSDAQLLKSAKIVADFADGYGLPDRTWDLAWLTAGLVSLPAKDKTLEEVTGRLVNKLLLGQIASGPAAGLWGPVCINHELLARMLKYEQDITAKDIAHWEEILKRNPESAHGRKGLNKAKAWGEKIQKEYKNVTTQGIWVNSVQSSMASAADRDWCARTGWCYKDSATLPGMPVHIYAEQTADLESTAVVLFALREAARNGYLPKATTVPKTSTGQTMVPKEETSAIIGRTLSAVADLVAKQPELTECNFWFPVKDYDSLHLPGVPGDPKAFKPVESRTLPINTLRAYSILANAKAIADGAKGPAQGEASIPQRKTDVLPALERKAVALANDVLSDRIKPADVGGSSPPYEFLFHLLPLIDKPTSATLAVRVVERILSAQMEGGSWGGAGREYAMDSSLLACLTQKMQAAHEEQQKSLPKGKQVPFNKATSTPAAWGVYARYTYPDVMASACSIALLAQVLDPQVRKPNTMVDWALVAKRDQEDADRKAAARDASLDGGSPAGETDTKK